MTGVNRVVDFRHKSKSKELGQVHKHSPFLVDKRGQTQSNDCQMHDTTVVYLVDRRGCDEHNPRLRVDRADVRHHLPQVFLILLNRDFDPRRGGAGGGEQGGGVTNTRCKHTKSAQLFYIEYICNGLEFCFGEIIK